MGPIWTLTILYLTLAATSVQVEAQITPGTVLKVTSVLDTPFLMLKDAGPNETLTGNARYEGYMKSLLDEVAKSVGFKYEISLAPENRYGAYQNESWNGMIGEIVNQRADLAAAPLTVTANRAIDIDFSVPFLNSGPVILMRKPVRSQPDSIFQRFLSPLVPFSDMVWLTILIAYLVTGFFLYMVSYCNPYEWRKMARDGLATIREAEAFTCLNTYWFLLSSFTWQGYVRAPRSLGGRIIGGFWWLFVVFCLVHYIAALTNYLRAKQSPRYGFPDLLSFRDLAKSNPVGIAVIKDGSTAEYFRTSSKAVNQKIWGQIESGGDLVRSVQEGIENVRRRPGYIFIMESAAAQFRASRVPCDLMHTEPGETPYFQAIGLPKGSPYRDAINIALLDLRHKGKLDMLKERWWVLTGQCSSDSMVPSGKFRWGHGPLFSTLNIGDFTGALIFLVIGIVAGCILTAIEFCIFKIAEKGDENASEESPSDVPAKKESDV